MKSINKQQPQKRSDLWLPEVGWERALEEGHRKAQTYRHQISGSWRRDGQQGGRSDRYRGVYLTAAEEVNLKNSHHKDIFFLFFFLFGICMRRRMLIYAGNHFAVYISKVIILFTLSWGGREERTEIYS